MIKKTLPQIIKETFEKQEKSNIYSSSEPYNELGIHPEWVRVTMDDVYIYAFLEYLKQERTQIETTPENKGSGTSNKCTKFSTVKNAKINILSKIISEVTEQNKQVETQT